MSEIDYNALMNQLKYMNTPPKTKPELSPLDRMTHTKEMLLMEVLLPYLDITYQKKLALILKILELKNMSELPDDNEEIVMDFSKEFNQIELLNEIRNHLDEPFYSKLNMIINLLNMNQYMSNDLHKEIPSDDKSSFTYTNKNDYSTFIDIINAAIKEKENG